jgi:hypothetical protein
MMLYSTCDLLAVTLCGLGGGCHCFGLDCLYCLHSSWGHAPTTTYDIRIHKTTRWKVTAVKTSDLTLHFLDDWLCDFEIDHRLGILADLKGNMQAVLWLYFGTTYLIVVKQNCNNVRFQETQRQVEKIKCSSRRRLFLLEFLVKLSWLWWAWVRALILIMGIAYKVLVP